MQLVGMQLKMQRCNSGCNLGCNDATWDAKMQSGMQGCNDANGQSDPFARIKQIVSSHTRNGLEPAGPHVLF